MPRWQHDLPWLFPQNSPRWVIYDDGSESPFFKSHSAHSTGMVGACAVHSTVACASKWRSIMLFISWNCCLLAVIVLFASFMRADCRLRNEDVWGFCLAFLGCIGLIHIILVGNVNLRGRLFNAMSSTQMPTERHFPNVRNTRSCPVEALAIIRVAGTHRCCVRQSLLAWPGIWNRSESEHSWAPQMLQNSFRFKMIQGVMVLDGAWWCWSLQIRLLYQNLLWCLDYLRRA